MNEITVGEWWTCTKQEDECEWAEAIKIIGKTPKGRIRILIIHFVVVGSYKTTYTRHRIVKPKTILAEYKQNDLEFLVKHGGVRTFVKKCFDLTMENHDDDIKACKRKIRKVQKEKVSLEQMMKSILE